MKSTFFLYFVFFIFLVSSVSAHSYISPGKYELKFLPNNVKTLEFRVGGTGEYSYKVISGLAEVEIVDEIKSDDDTILKVRIKFPDNIDTPGKIKVARVEVEQTITETDGFGSQTRVVAPIYAIVPYNGVYLENSLKVSNINVNETLKLEVESENLGNTDADNVKVDVNIYDDNKLIKTVPFETKSVSAGKKSLYRNTWDSTGYSEGTYKAEAVIEYDGNEDKVSKEFEIGTLNVEIINVTQELVTERVNPFEIYVRNGWNGQLVNVYGILELEGKQYKTVSNNLNPLSIGKLEGFADTRSIGPGNYNVKVKVDFGSKNTEKEFTIKIIDSQEWYTGTLVIPAIILLIALNIIYMFMRRRHENKNKKRKK